MTDTKHMAHANLEILESSLAYDEFSVFDADAMAKASAWSKEQIIDNFRTGTAASRLVEQAICDRYGLEWVGSQQQSFDAVKGTLRYEIKTCGVNGFKPIPSSAIGSGRSFNLERFREYCEGIAGFIVVDIAKSPELRVLSLSGQDALALYLDPGEFVHGFSMGLNGEIDRKYADELFAMSERGQKLLRGNSFKRLALTQEQLLLAVYEADGYKISDYGADTSRRHYARIKRLKSKGLIATTGYHKSGKIGHPEAIFGCTKQGARYALWLKNNAS